MKNTIVNDRDISLYGVVGNPISHSISPQIHNEWIAKHKLKAFYTPLWIENDQNFIDIIPTLPKLGFCGLNITLPYKEIAYKICTNIDEDAKNIGAVNCIKFDSNQITGYNTDCFGFLQPLSDKKLAKNLGGKKALIIGAGGASRAIIYGLLKSGVGINIVNRTPEKITILQKTFSKIGQITPIDKTMSVIDLSEYDVIVNTTSLGLHGESLNLPYHTLKKHTICYDLIYGKTKTLFLQQAEKHNAITIDGTSMLYNQAAMSFKIWHGYMPD